MQSGIDSHQKTIEKQEQLKRDTVVNVNRQKRQLARDWVNQSNFKLQQEMEEIDDHKNYFNKVLVVRDIENLKKQDQEKQARRDKSLKVRLFTELQHQEKLNKAQPMMHSGINLNSSVIL